MVNTFDAQCLCSPVQHSLQICFVPCTLLTRAFCHTSPRSCMFGFSDPWSCCQQASTNLVSRDSKSRGCWDSLLHKDNLVMIIKDSSLCVTLCQTLASKLKLMLCLLVNVDCVVDTISDSQHKSCADVLHSKSVPHKSTAWFNHFKMWSWYEATQLEAITEQCSFAQNAADCASIFTTAANPHKLDIWVNRMAPEEQRKNLYRNTPLEFSKERTDFPKIQLWVSSRLASIS